jgi:hypothetical protein
MALAGAIHPLFANEPAAEAAAIRSLLKQSFDKPDAPLQIESLAVATTHAVAGWRQGARGGRALLRQQAAGWSIVLCSGEPLTRVDGLIAAGVAVDEARTLEAGVAAQDAKLDDDTRRLLSGFEGTVVMTGGSHSSHPIQDH